MESDAAVHPGQPASAGAADVAVTALYQAHALGLIRLAYLMLGDSAAAEDVVQEAFTGLYRRWAHLSDPAKALPYVRSSILNACRTQLRRLGRQPPGAGEVLPPAISAEAAALSGEDRRAVLSALRRLPGRQREVLVLRYYVNLTDSEIAADLGVTRGTVASTASRALAALGKELGGRP
jgi:RNA polymerase sigma-70 factor (sigma-E family)